MILQLCFQINSKRIPVRCGASQLSILVLSLSNVWTVMTTVQFYDTPSQPWCSSSVLLCLVWYHALSLQISSSLWACLSSKVLVDQVQRRLDRDFIVASCAPVLNWIHHAMSLVMVLSVPSGSLPYPLNVLLFCTGVVEVLSPAPNATSPSLHTFILVEDLCIHLLQICLPLLVMFIFHLFTSSFQSSFLIPFCFAETFNNRVNSGVAPTSFTFKLTLSTWTCPEIRSNWERTEPLSKRHLKCSNSSCLTYHRPNTAGQSRFKIASQSTRIQLNRPPMTLIRNESAFARRAQQHRVLRASLSPNQPVKPCSEPGSLAHTFGKIKTKRRSNIPNTLWYTSIPWTRTPKLAARSNRSWTLAG